MNATSTPESYAEHIYVLDKNNEYVEKTAEVTLAHADNS